MFPVAVTCGNTFVLKPSEKDPGELEVFFKLAYVSLAMGAIVIIILLRYEA